MQWTCGSENNNGLPGAMINVPSNFHPQEKWSQCWALSHLPFPFCVHAAFSHYLLLLNLIGSGNAWLLVHTHWCMNIGQESTLTQSTMFRQFFLHLLYYYYYYLLLLLQWPRLSHIVGSAGGSLARVFTNWLARPDVWLVRAGILNLAMVPAIACLLFTKDTVGSLTSTN